MRAPGFWYRKPGLAAALLSPLSLIWRWVTKRRLSRTGFRADIPVICVGNLTVGGTGKTPTVIALAALFSEAGINAHGLSRGYGGTLKGPIAVNPTMHSASDVGDEPLLLAAFLSTWVSRDRAAGAAAIQATGADVIIMDDGFQNPDLHKDLSLIVVDAGIGFGNRRVMPAGPLREPVDAGLARADAVILIGSQEQRAQFLGGYQGRVPVFEAVLEPLQTGISLTGQSVVAFAGIGRPAKFFTTLRDMGADVIAGHSFGDHEPYSDAVLTRLQKQARSENAQLVTTEKDAVRLPPAFRSEVMTVPVRLRFEDTHAVSTLLHKVIA